MRRSGCRATHAVAGRDQSCVRGIVWLVVHVPLGVVAVVAVVRAALVQRLPTGKGLGHVHEQRMVAGRKEFEYGREERVVDHEEGAVRLAHRHADVLPYLAAHGSAIEVLLQGCEYAVDIGRVIEARQIEGCHPGEAAGMLLL